MHCCGLILHDISTGAFQLRAFENTQYTASSPLQHNFTQIEVINYFT